MPEKYETDLLIFPLFFEAHTDFWDLIFIYVSCWHQIKLFFVSRVSIDVVA